MSVDIVHDSENDVAVLFCDTSMWAFGPVIRGPDADEKAHAFLAWFGADPRLLEQDEFEQLWGRFLLERVCPECGSLAEECCAEFATGSDEHDEECDRRGYTVVFHLGNCPKAA